MWNTRHQSYYRDEGSLLTRFLRDLDKQVATVVGGNGKQGRAVARGDGEQDEAVMVASEKDKGLACQIW